MQISTRLARIVGPTLVVLGLTEALNIDRFAGNPVQVVYLNGTLLFLAGLAIVQAHNRWVADWPIALTLIGWALMLGGFYRMLAPQAPQLGGSLTTYAVLAVLVTVGAGLSYKGYRRRTQAPDRHREGQ